MMVEMGHPRQGAEAEVDDIEDSQEAVLVGVAVGLERRGTWTTMLPALVAVQAVQAAAAAAATRNP